MFIEEGLDSTKRSTPLPACASEQRSQLKRMSIQYGTAFACGANRQHQSHLKRHGAAMLIAFFSVVKAEDLARLVETARRLPVDEEIRRLRLAIHLRMHVCRA